MKAPLKIIASHPNIEFTVAVMSWPLDISADGFQQWKKSLTNIANYPNVCLKSQL